MKKSESPIGFRRETQPGLETHIKTGEEIGSYLQWGLLVRTGTRCGACTCCTPGWRRTPPCTRTGSCWTPCIASSSPGWSRTPRSADTSRCSSTAPWTCRSDTARTDSPASSCSARAGRTPAGSRCISPVCPSQSLCARRWEGCRCCSHEGPRPPEAGAELQTPERRRRKRQRNARRGRIWQERTVCAQLQAPSLHLPWWQGLLEHEADILPTLKAPFILPPAPPPLRHLVVTTWRQLVSVPHNTWRSR